jgi:DNA-binding IclR family transcriptional regulator
MTSLNRMLGLLDLFTERAPVWKVEALTEHSGLSRATAYRYVRELCDAGFLARVTASDYALGPRIIELDRQIRVSDPLITAGQPVVAELVAETGEIGLLASLYGDRMICVHVEHSPRAGVRVLIERGHVLPLFRGSIARIILAHLPYRRLHELYAGNAAAIAEAGLAHDWPSFLKALREIRAAGHYVSMGELNPAVRAIGAPLFNGEGDILGSLTLAMRRAHFTAARRDALVAATLAAAGRINRALARLTGTPRKIAPAARRRPLSRRSA